MKFVIAALTSIIAVVAALASAAFGTRPLDPWYQNLTKPSWQPEPSTIGLAWSVIYPLMVIASTMVLLKTENASRWWIFFGANLILNAIWSWIFFVYQQPNLGSIFLALLVASVAVLIVVAGQVWWLPAVLLTPYLLWTSIAFAVNFTIARLNP